MFVMKKLGRHDPSGPNWGSVQQVLTEDSYVPDTILLGPKNPVIHKIIPAFKLSIEKIEKKKVKILLEVKGLHGVLWEHQGRKLAPSEMLGWVTSEPNADRSIRVRLAKQGQRHSMGREPRTLWRMLETAESSVLWMTTMWAVRPVWQQGPRLGGPLEVGTLACP